MENIKFETPEPKTKEIRVFNYGARLDPESRSHVFNQIFMARKLYNNIVARMRDIFTEMHAHVLSKAGADAQLKEEEISALNEQFKAARADNDEAAMKQIAQERREKRIELGRMLKDVRIEIKDELKEKFYSRIGNNSACDTYQLRCQSVEEGLGWATATYVLNAALLAYKTSIKNGKPPRFSVGAEKLQDSLVLQFTQSGGISSEILLAGKHKELVLRPPEKAASKKYGSFAFRLGKATDNTYATGTWQMHRPFPNNSFVKQVFLTTKRIGKDYRHYLQFIVNDEADQAAEALPTIPRKKLASVHMGWALLDEGRHIAAIAEHGDPGGAEFITLPESIERDLQHAQQLQSERDELLNKFIPVFKALSFKLTDEQLKEEFDQIKKLQPKYISSRRLQFFEKKLYEANIFSPELRQWHLDDKRLHQNVSHISYRARMRRRNFYRETASKLTQDFECIVINRLDLKKAAIIINEDSGERTDMKKKARTGRVIASLSEFDGALRWACAKSNTVVIDAVGETTRVCGYCGEKKLIEDEKNAQNLICTSCGAVINRKRNGAAVSWQFANQNLEQMIKEAKELAVYLFEQKKLAKKAKNEKMAEGRSLKRAKKQTA